MAQETKPVSGAEEKEYMGSGARDDSSSTVTEDAHPDAKESGAPSKETEVAPPDQNDADIEAATAITKIPTHKSTTSNKSHSIISKLSKRKTREKLPPPILPTTDLSKGIIGWDSQTDPEMPLNFSPFRKWLLVALLSIITFMSPFASSILAPALGSLEKEYHETDITKGSMPVSIFVLGYAVGPLFLSPLSEIYGRNVILISANAFFCVWLIGCALAPSLDLLIFFRFMCGIGGSACTTIGGALIADMFPVSERGRAMTIWMLGPMFGPTLGPLVGAFVSQTIGWRWVNWISFIPATSTVIAMVFINRETNHQVLIERKVRKLRVELNRPELQSCYFNPDAPPLTKNQILMNGLVRPFKMLFTSAIIFSVSLYIAFAYGCLYLLFNTIPPVFQDTYHFSIGITGLVYLSLLVGYMFGLGLFYTLSDKTVVRMTKANNGVYEPEMRLPDCIWFALAMPVTFFWFGWSADKAAHWIVPIIGLVPFGFGIIGVWLPIQAYIVDAYPQYAASGLAAFSVLRSTVGAFLPLAGPQMFRSLGVGWGASVLGFISIALIPIPALIYRYGGRMRRRFPLNL
ncbi:fluconazole resistance protein [Pochonia chlamydosporia 170]|uniref:Fluconazole resistance protein n=1 Tax=Pochonia chlamydosporia 170 TaxID=1380566 RepID=A0A179F2Q8_METCM|nr:fluconazole resistance protein [Pochonia chlamydosporia 170]OAQ59707.1 fluconazole resistance protein [Pochonia chlamydosporia 170]